MQYSATAKYIRVSTRKVRLIAGAIRSMHPTKALIYLASLPHRSAKPMSAVIKSALANAKNKNIDNERLRFSTIEIMGGPMMKRWRSVSRGQAHTYKKRMTHIRVVLTDEEK